MTPKIGITGGIGAGKTIIGSVFRSLGIPIYNADDRARYLMNHDEELIREIKAHFGDEAYQEGLLNRSYMADHIFNHEEKRKKINGLVHPRVREDYHRWHQAQLNHPYTLKEAALLFESGSYIELGKVILVYAPRNLRMERVLMRDPYRKKEDVLKIMENQWPEDRKKKEADYVINNDDKEMVLPQILRIHKKIMGSGSRD